jgi:hypothetical protein
VPLTKIENVASLGTGSAWAEAWRAAGPPERARGRRYNSFLRLREARQAPSIEKRSNVIHQDISTPLMFSPEQYRALRHGLARQPIERGRLRLTDGTVETIRGA